MRTFKEFITEEKKDSEKDLDYFRETIMKNYMVNGRIGMPEVEGFKKNPKAADEEIALLKKCKNEREYLFADRKGFKVALTRKIRLGIWDIWNRALKQAEDRVKVKIKDEE